MANKLSDLKAELSPERLERIEKRKEELLMELELRELRKALNVTQQQLAERLGVEQSSVSRAERRRDLLVSTLRSIVEAMGGELEVRARFPDAEVSIQFERPDAEEKRVPSGD